MNGAMACRGRGRQAGFLLEECLVYLAVSSILLGLAFAAFYRVMENAGSLRRSAGDIARVLQAGERWRDDVRRADGPIRMAQDPGTTAVALHLPRAAGAIVYWFTDTNVVRQAGAGGTRTEVLASLKRSRLIAESAGTVTGWRWEVELNAGRKEPLVRPLFTFEAAPGISTAASP